MAINQGFIAMPPRDGISNLFLHYWCKASLDEIINYANGSTFLEISKGNFRMIHILSPSIPVLNAYCQLASVFYNRIVTTERTSRALSVQRDALLPKLVSGEIRVEDIGT